MKFTLDSRLFAVCAFGALLTFSTSADQSARRKVILDTDIGADLDDQVAVAYLAQEPLCELVGVTTVGGGSHVRASMVSSILRHVGRGDVPVFPGVTNGVSRNTRVGGNGPNVGQILAKWAHDEYRPGNKAVEFMRRTIRENPGEISLIAIGPFSNVATLFREDPEIPSLIRELVVMGGNFSGEIEWNALCDPEATAVIYDMWKGPGRFLSVGNDVTGKTHMNEAEARRFFEGRRSLGPAYDLAQAWLNSHHYAILHDPLACVALFHPEVCTTAKARIVVSLDGATAGSCTRIPPWYSRVLAAPDAQVAPEPHTVATDANVGLFYEILSKCLK